MTDLITPVRGDVPLDMHPDALTPHVRTLDQEKTVGASVLVVGREALSVAYEGYGRLNDAESALRQLNAKPYARMRGVQMQNGRPTQPLQSEELIAAATQAFERIAPAIDRRVKELERHRTALRSRVDEAIDDKSRRTPEGLSQASEMRGHIKSLGKNRMVFVTSAIDRGDIKTASAVLAAPAYLSGLTDAEFDTIKVIAEQKFAPVESQQLAATDSVLDRVTHSGSRLLERYGRVLGMRDTATGKARQKVAELARHGAK